jgi:hypothetical protein
MPVRPEIMLRLPNSPGALADVCRLLAAEHVGILACMVEPSSRARLIVDNPLRAEAVLRERHPQVEMRDVVALRVANAHGALAEVLGLMSQAGVNIEYAYTGVGEHGAGALAVVGVDDPMRAAAAAGA